MLLYDLFESIKERDAVHPDHAAVFAQAVRFPNLNSAYYDMYRVAMDTAARTGTENTLDAKHGAIANNMVVTAYSPIELDMVRASAAALGHEVESITAEQSNEPSSVNRSSPVKGRAPVQLKRKVK
jgi:hypothetical protein